MSKQYRIGDTTIEVGQTVTFRGSPEVFRGRLEADAGDPLPGLWYCPERRQLILVPRADDPLLAGEAPGETSIPGFDQVEPSDPGEILRPVPHVKDDALVAAVKAMINTMEIPVADAMRALGYSQLYALRTRHGMTAETAEKWATFLKLRLVISLE